MTLPAKSWIVGSLGLTDGETKLLMSLAPLTRSRSEGAYQIGNPGNMSDWNMVVLNLEDEGAAALWRTLATSAHPPVPILYSAAPPAVPDQYHLLRPFAPARLLAVLDSIAKTLNESAQLWERPIHQPATAATLNGEATLRALVVDDSPTVTKQIELELRKVNVHSDKAESGEKALEMVILHKYDLIFLDVVLPGTDGYSVCKELRKNPKTKQTPVIMLTSKSSPFDKVRGSLAGCSAYLTKPVDYNSFREAVGKYVKM